MIRVKHLRKLYDDCLAVQDVSLEIQSGTVCGLVGKNGAGKTSTLRCLAGLIPPTDGQIEMAGFCPQSDPVSVKRLVAYVPDDPPLFDDLTVGQHLDFIAQLYGIRDHRCTAFALLERFELTRKYDAMTNSLSRGMRQKLAIACAYLTQPRILLLDEPLTGLDPPGIRCLLDSVRDFVRQGHVAIISSHLLAMIQDVCDEVCIMNEGSVHYHGPLKRLPEAFGTHTLEDAFFAATESMTPSAVG
ncbi:MAG: ABC transporter ATP-binding protein [Planctomycetota bacterium]